MMQTILVILWLLLNYFFSLPEEKVNKNISQTPVQDRSPFICNTEFPKIEKAPAFPGGSLAWRKYLKKKVKYPEAAISHNTEGVIRVQMTIEKNGDISNVEFLNDPGFGLGEEAVSVIKSSPRWKPAIQNGRPIPYRIIQTITFRLQ